jgi:hypothetical protein
MPYKTAISECANCKHKWVELVGERGNCFLCGSNSMKKPLFVGQVRETYRKLSPNDKDYSVRKPILEKLYFENTPLILGRAKEVFEKVSPIYYSGDLADRVLNRLIFCFFAFEEIGLHESAVSCGNMVALGYTNRGEKIDVTRETDLADLGRALQWFGLLGQEEWIASVNTRLGILAAHSITEDASQSHRLCQIAHKHLELSRRHYVEHNLPEAVASIDRELEHVVRIEAGAVVGRGYEKGAETQAQATRDAAQVTKGAIEYIGLSLIQSAQITSGAIIAHGGMVSDAIEDGSKRVEKGLIDAGGRIGIALDGFSESVRSGLGQVSGSLVRLGDKTQEGLHQLAADIGDGLRSAGDKVSNEMSSMGNKIALGVIGGGAIGGLLARDTLLQLGTNVSNSLGSASNVLAEATRWSGEVQAGPQNVLLSEGFDAIRQRLT